MAGNKTRIFTIAGFLGDESQFSFLNDRDIFFIDKKTILTKNIDDIVLIIKNNSSAKNIILGYSLGSRIAMQIFLKAPDMFEKCLLLAGHAGLKTKDEKIEREVIERKFIDKIKSSNQEEFIHWWNNLELFNGDMDITPMDYSKEEAIACFELWGLSKQEYLLDQLLINKNKIEWFFGSKDIKYMNYANKELKQFKVNAIENQGHRVYQSFDTQEIIRKMI